MQKPEEINTVFLRLVLPWQTEPLVNLALDAVNLALNTVYLAPDTVYLLLNTIIWRFLRDMDIMRVAFLEGSSGNLDKFPIFL